MNKSILFGSIIAAVIVTGVIAGVESVEAKPPEPLPAAVCPAGNVQHWETISWASGVEFEHPTLASVSGGIVKTQVDINTVFSYNELAAAALNNLGYLNSGNPIIASDVTFAVNPTEPQIICAES